MTKKYKTTWQNCFKVLFSSWE